MKIVLFDLDGTLCDYYNCLWNALEKIREHNEPKIYEDYNKEYLRQRVKLIRNNSLWWANIPKFQLGWDIWAITQSLNYRHIILTTGPNKIPSSFKGKKIWVDKHIGKTTELILASDKSLVNGNILVDDTPEQLEGWLNIDINRIAIMPLGHKNKWYTHERMRLYDGSNLKEIKKFINNFKNP